MAAIALNVLNRCLLSTGSTWATKQQLIEFMKHTDGHISDIEDGVRRGEIIQFKDYYSTKKFAEYEDKIAYHVMRIQYVNPAKQYPDYLIKALVADFEEERNEGRKLHFHQVDAVIMVVNNNVSVLTGGPGTGKTTVLSAITYVLRRLQEDMKIIFTAPTGKAARRVTESTKEFACTLHKQFGLGYESKKANTFFEDVLFVDESSMNDIEISALLFEAVKDGRKVVYIGDIDQLPSVGPGAVLRDLIASGVVPVTMLTHTFRQDNSSVLYENICNIRNGIPKLVEGPDFHSILLPKGNQQKKAAEILCSEYKKAVEKYGAENVVALIPYRKSGFCSNAINNILQKMLNHEQQGYRHTNESERNTVFFKKGDFVMQLENRDECANGDVGKVVSVSSDGVKVEYVTATVMYEPQELEQLALAYAMTIHKSQGSEYAFVIMCLLDDHKEMLQRNLVYTGITRAKKECLLVYQKDAFETAVKTKAEASRLTMLAEKLKEIRAQYKMVYGI